MIKRSGNLYLVLLLTLLVGGSCKKAFLNKLPSTALVVPSSLSDYQGLLNNTVVMGVTPVLGEVSADNMYLTASSWQRLDVLEQNAYTWSADLYAGQGLLDDWDIPYQQVFYANTVLEGLGAIPVTTANAAEWKAEQGSALFLRAYAFFNIAGQFAVPYDSLTAASDLGIPLRLKSDVTAPSVRASLAATYQQVIGDLEQARLLLPSLVPGQGRDRPSQPAALALLARVYLSMRLYVPAYRYADSALQRNDSLMDYNRVDTVGNFPFDPLNAEVLYQSNVVGSTQCMAGVGYPGTVIDSVLYRSYGPGDLRRQLFYKLNSVGQPNLKAGYAYVVYPFTGLATDELYLIRAECAARMGNGSAALTDLNTLLSHRYAAGRFTPVAVSGSAVLDTILTERRKELPFRGLRWSDLRRLNKEGRTILVQRLLNGQVYQLLPNSKGYTLPIPPDVISDNPGMPQNPR